MIQCVQQAFKETSRRHQAFGVTPKTLEYKTAFVFVHTYARASLEKKVNKPLSTIPYTPFVLFY